MPVDDLLIFAYLMLSASIILCGLFPMISRLLNARRHFHRDETDRRLIRFSCPHAFLPGQSIYTDVQLDVLDIHRTDVNIPYIDEENSV